MANKKIVWAGGISHTMNHPGLDPNQKLIMHHPAVAVIAVNGNQQKPSPTYCLPQGKNNITCHCLFHPIDKTLRACVEKNDATYEKLTAEEIDYFKKKGNNVTLFVHGFSVSKGYFGGMDAQWRLKPGVSNPEGNNQTEMLVYSSGPPCTYLRTYADLNFPTGYPDINGLWAATDHERDRAIDSGVNGSDACNWLLHMEYNLNCAAAGQYPFPWEEQALQYTRILNLHWNGNVFFDLAQKHAELCGRALAEIIDTLHQEGLTINIVAHSLGNLVLLTGLEHLVNQGKREYVDTAIMWEAAVPQTALSPLPLDNPADRIPHGYFPNAHAGAKRFTVLYSHEDDVLKDAYTIEQYFDHISHPEYILPAMGYAGPDEFTRKQLGDKLVRVNQLNWLKGHSKMRLPNKELFKHVYVDVIMNKDKGLKCFAKYPNK